MANKEKKHLLSDSTKRILILVLGSIASTLVLAFSVLTILSVNDGTYYKAPNYLIWVFVFLAVTRLLTFLKDRTKINFIRTIVLFAYDIALGIIILFAKNNTYVFSLVGGLYCISIIVSRVFIAIQKRTVRSIIFNAIVVTLAIVLAIGMFIPTDKESVLVSIVLIECVFIAVSAFVEVAEFAFGQLKFRILFKIVMNTFALEIIFGLLTMMVASSLVIMTVEPTITNFPDALWYCFAVVTTIGFGDFHAETPVGRILTVLLGVYGIVVVAVITSIIVNFYNETSGRQDQKELKNIKKEEDKK